MFSVVCRFFTPVRVGIFSAVGGESSCLLPRMFHSSGNLLKDKATLVRSSTDTGPRKSKFAKDEEETVAKKERSEEQKAKLQKKREERAEKKKEIRKIQLDRNKQKEAKLAEKKAAVSAKKNKKNKEEDVFDDDE